MDFIQTSNKAVNLFGAGKHGFQLGNSGTGIPATSLNDAWCNDVQQELINAITQAGLTPTAGVQMQLLNAIGILTRRMYGRYAAAGGTADALTGDFTPDVTALTDGLTVRVRAGAANTTATPSFAADATAAKTIVKNNGVALVAGDIAGSGHELELQYDTTLDKWILLNPAVAARATTADSATSAGTAGAAGTCSGNAATATTAGACSGNSATATRANALGNGGGTTPMTFNWSAQSGQPSWVWGGNDVANHYAYNPSNFSVAYAANSGACSGNAASANNANYATTSGTCSGNAATATRANTLGQGGGSTAMTFNWSGQGGQPTWVWGGNDGVNHYVYNPSNFSVAYAANAGACSGNAASANNANYATTSGTCSGNAATASNATNASYATTQAVGTANTTIATTAFVNPANSIGSTGYIKLASGLILQWGLMGSWSSVTFPITFPNSCFSVGSTMLGGGNHEHGVSSYSVSGFSPQTNGNTSAFFWMAIGY